jgi:hypothetical protein
LAGAKHCLLVVVKPAVIRTCNWKLYYVCSHILKGDPLAFLGEARSVTEVKSIHIFTRSNTVFVVDGSNCNFRVGNLAASSKFFWVRHRSSRLKVAMAIAKERILFEGWGLIGYD